jgi:hypothetical protein
MEILGGSITATSGCYYFLMNPKQDEILLPQDLNVMREVQAEVILSPLAAKKISKWLTKYVEEFEKKIGHIPEPQLNDGD